MIVIAAAALASLIVYCALFIAQPAEPWDSPAYVPLLAIVSVAAAFARPRAVVLSALTIVAAQSFGWLLVTALFDRQSLAAWPLVVFFTVPLFVAPLVAAAALVGAAGGYLWQRLRSRPAE